ncbi:MAG: CinA family protein [Bifidobacteriaceae bacterium]|jgi:PncC family amidohydrolase|nr:CinA family protein [Bifidobacteriaceae bacterium]
MDDLAEKIIEKMQKSKKTFAIAESFTGGLLSDSFVKVPGASKAFLGSVIAYSNNVKNSILGVSNSVLNKDGAVSSKAALEMAKGVREKLGSDIGISTTGIAGPDNQEGKQVGLIYVAVAADNFEQVQEFVIENKGRQFIRLSGVDKAQKMLYTYINGESL